MSVIMRDIGLHFSFIILTFPSFCKKILLAILNCNCSLHFYLLGGAAQK